jgi:peptidoglycan/LPS O-acetylase OafA/YrhL
MSQRPSSLQLNPSHFTMLDGMRGIGSLVIVAGHAMMPLGLYPWIPHAQVGVDLFFALSGFVICHAYQRRMELGMTAGDFAQRRLIRLYPIIPIAVLFGALVYAIKVLVQQRPDLLFGVAGSSLLHALFLPSPFLIADKEIEGWAINPPLWSLTAELVANLAFGFGLWKLRVRGLALLAASGAFAFAMCAAYVGVTNVGGEWHLLYIGAARVVYPFCAGMILWRLTRGHRPRWQMPGWLALALMLAIILAPDMGGFNLYYGLLSIWLLVPLIVYVGAFRSSISSPFVLLLGELSYPMYLVHFPVVRIFTFAGRQLGLTEHPVLMVLIQVLVSAVLGYVVWRFYDVPVRNWLTALSKKRSASVTARPAQAMIEPAE